MYLREAWRPTAAWLSREKVLLPTYEGDHACGEGDDECRVHEPHNGDRPEEECLDGLQERTRLCCDRANHEDGQPADNEQDQQPEQPIPYRGVEQEFHDEILIYRPLH